MRRLLALLLASAAILSLGARCIENVTVEKDAEGYTHIRGEIYNDTDIQGRFIILRATLFGAGGDVIAEKDSGLCPAALQPKGESVFDIRFDDPNLPPFATYSIRAVTGLASDQQLPDPKIAVTGSSAKRDGQDVTIRIDVKNNSGKEYFNLFGCGAAYDAAGKVVQVVQSAFHNLNDAGTPTPGEGLGSAPDYFEIHVRSVPVGATTVRGWIFIQEPLGDQGYQALMTGPITIAP